MAFTASAASRSDPLVGMITRSARLIATPTALEAVPSSVLSLTEGSRPHQAVRVWGHDQDRGMHLAVACGSGDAGGVGERAEHAAEAGLAGTDCPSVG